MASPAPPAKDDKLFELFAEVEKTLLATQLGAEKWYIITAACLVAGPDPESVAQLYLYLISKPELQTSSSRQALIRRIREALVKSISLVGVPKPIEAVLAISKVERPEDTDHSCTREGWQRDAANEARATAWLRRIYAGNTADTLALFKDHADLAWVSTHITYGLFLGDRQVLDDLDTEMVVLPAIMSQNLPLETGWHIRGTRRIGVSKEDTRTVCKAVHRIAGHFGVTLHRLPVPDTIDEDARI